MSAGISVVSFKAGMPAQPSAPPADRILTGQPVLRVSNHFEDPSGQFFAGEWSATRGSWRVCYSEHEFCHLLAGRVAIIDQTGHRWEFAPGDSFVIPAGFDGVWEVIEDCRKLYAIFEPRKTDPPAGASGSR